MLITAAAVWTWTNLIEPFHPRLRQRPLFLPRLSPQLDGLSILHLSDLHIRQMGLLERKLIRLLSRTSADIAVFTGDLVDSDEGIPPLLEIISRVRATLGIYAVWGNSEHKPDRLSHPEKLEQALASAGVQLLNNTAKTIQHRRSTIWLGGVDDPHLGHANLSGVISFLWDADVYILLAHSPDVLMDPLTERFDLILCGHTHCGQIRIPPWGALWSHARLGRWVGDPVLHPNRIARRLRRSLPQPHVAVSPGVATVGAPLFKARLFCPPEITLLVLRSSAFAPARKPANASPNQGT